MSPEKLAELYPDRALCVLRVERGDGKERVWVWRAWFTPAYFEHLHENRQMGLPSVQ